MNNLVSNVSFFSFGPHDSYISKSHEGLRYRDLPPTLQQLVLSGSVRDVHWAALGPVEESWVLSFKDREGKDNLGWGASTPPTLQEILKGLTPTSHLRVFFGPDSSFIAWSPGFIRWSGLPLGLEACLQSWLTPSGWKSGPPRLATWGRKDAFFALSEYGDAKFSVGVGDKWPLYAETLDEWGAESGFEWASLAYISLDPVIKDQFFAIRQDRTWAGSIDDECEEALESFASNFFHRSKSKKSKPKASANEGSRVNNGSEARDMVPDAATQATYEKWATEVATSFAMALAANGGAKAKPPKKLQVRSQTPKPTIPSAIAGSPKGKLLTQFPYLPATITMCRLASCTPAKADPDGLRACKHDVERLYRASGLYSFEWLRQERIRWHPDRFGRLCEENWRDKGRKLAEEMFKMIDSLISDLDRQRVNGGT